MTIEEVESQYRFDISNSKKSNHKKSIKEKIIAVLKSYNYPLNAKKISILAGCNYNTARTYLNQLSKEGRIVKVSRGFYCINPTLGVGSRSGVSGLRIHNVWFVVKVGGIFESGVVEEVVGGVKVKVIFGTKRGLVSGVICCDSGLDFNGFRLAVELAKWIIEDRLRVKISEDNVLVSSFELNEDYGGYRLNGLKCLTLRSFTGWLERIYNKGEGLRHEVKVNGKFSLEEVYRLFKGGISTYNIVQSNFILSRKIEELTNAIKFQNRQFYEMSKLDKAIFELLLKILKKLEENRFE
ncbi:MAG: hypothetical protein DRO18_08185 [Thermoprotei archaeon]|nr:MAG: hypothetical protein DRO18_08185 [Thermoprotei archaeon]